MYHWKDWKDVPLPARMQKLKRDSRGYPVPYVILYGKDGRPYFQINDSEKIMQVILERRCAVCGDKLGDDAWLVGGPLSAFHEHGAYIDPGGHGDCLRYALQVCPYLAVAHYNSRIDVKNVKMDNLGDNLILLDPTIMKDRPTLFVMVHITGFRLSLPKNYLIPDKPYLEVEFWQHGNRLTDEFAIKLIKNENS